MHIDSPLLAFLCIDEEYYTQKAKKINTIGIIY